ncbi:substrate-binding domain-containing protein [Desulfocurvibacter africanus]|uniref:ABC transporter periplasmic substrate-binding protein n=1 Tax=Desulfocurvibacter africanus subsp. africanus str. Walvis Bay TaxID=690850 RepID=F3Z288_DESAF|nr:substrate-binding domain-containing protein [Desulfocurvibacter africanus]EGJ50128.1 ABC transporter periplasmic substrate-binding protein [Desulfocurvibacter africanus subsp. africanus str. Walvis Bay]
MKKTLRILSLSLTLTLTAALMLAAPLMAAETLMMATTTSTDDTGLLDYLAPKFTEDTGIELRWTATGTGKALKLGETCDVDVLLVHAPSAEKKFVEQGFGDMRTEVMYNDFVIMGPKSDPAKVKGKSVAEALAAIRKNGATFVSRGDNSGTHKAELALWDKVGGGTPDKEKWYVSTGQGMLQSIAVATEKNGYVMADRGTFIKYEADNKGNPPLVILVEGDKVLFNQYSVVTLSQKNCPNAKHALAKQYSDWMASKKTQKLIGDFKLMGKQLFTPNAK